MKTIYKGFELEAKRDKCQGGWDIAYYSIYRVDDGYEVLASFTEGMDSLSSIIGNLKQNVDEFLEHPEYYEDI